jgi:hypothetical protein
VGARQFAVSVPKPIPDSGFLFGRPVNPDEVDDEPKPDNNGSTTEEKE